MLQIEKLFEKITPINYSIGSSFVNNKIRIKDDCFSIKSIYKIAEHFKWMKENMDIYETKIIIDSNYIADQSVLTLMEMLIYFVSNEWNFKVTYRFSINENVIGYQIFRKSILFKHNNRKLNLNQYNDEYNKKLIIDRTYFRKICENTEENKKGKFLSITMGDIDIFLKCFEFDDEYRSELAEVIIEIVDNALKHSNGDCILTLNVLKSDHYRYQYVEVTTVVIDDIFIGKEIIEYINKKDKSEYSEKNKIVLTAFEKHKLFFNEKYNINSFAMVSAFQKYVTTRKLSMNAGGTGLTKLINELIEKSTNNFCYVSSGNTNLIFDKEVLKLSDKGLIGFNYENDYLGKIPSEKIVHINKYDMNLNVYNLQFVLKEKENGK